MLKKQSNFFKILGTVCILFCLLGLTAFAADKNIADDIYYPSVASASIKPQKGYDGKIYLFLPTNANFQSLTLNFSEEDFSSVTLSANEQTISIQSGKAFDFTPLMNASGEHLVTVSATFAGKAQTAEIIFMKSENLRSLYITSDDPVQHGRPYVDASKNNKNASGTLDLISADGQTDYNGKIKEIKGRGNSSFASFEKKPYQIKLNEKAELIQGAGSAKKWILLNNGTDQSMLRNALTFDVASKIGLPFTSAYEYVDVYYDGEYRGTYLLTEKVEIDKSRINISNTDDLIEDLNKGTPAYENPVVKTASVSSKGKEPMDGNQAGSFRYVDGLKEPALPANSSHQSYLLEIDIIGRYAEEMTGFVTNKGQAITTKTPEYLTQSQGVFIAEFWQEFEDAVYSKDGYNAKTGKYYYDYCDLDSLAKFYALNELAKNIDGFITSTYFYLPADSDKLVCAPVWDYDIAYGHNYKPDPNYTGKNPKYFMLTGYYLVKGLMQTESFRDAVKSYLSDGGLVNKVFSEAIAENGSIDTNSKLIRASHKMNYKLWNIAFKNPSNVSVPEGTTFDDTIYDLRSFIAQRISWLAGEVSQWEGSNYTIVTGPPPQTTNPFVQFFKRIISFFKRIFDIFASIFR